VLTVKGINKVFRNFSLGVDSLSIGRGDYFVLIGPTGSGKTLLLNIIAGLVAPDSGSVFLDELDITGLFPEKRGFGIVYQDSALFPHLDVMDNIGFGLRMGGRSRKQARHEARGIMSHLGISHLSERGIQGLSGGEKQRVAIARAMIMKPRVLLLDEPFSSLDYSTKEDMIQFVKRIRQEYRPTVFHITHDFEEALILADAVGVINRGRLVQSGSVADIFRYPGDRFVANFVGAKNIFPGALSGSGDDTVFSTERGLDLYVGRAVENHVRFAMVRADDIVLSRSQPVGSATNVFRGRVTDIVYKRGINEVRLCLDRDRGAEGDVVDADVVHAFITTRSLRDMEIKQGDDLFASFKGSAIHLFR